MNSWLWQRATTLHERAARGRPTQVDIAHAGRRLARWRTLPAFQVEGADDEVALSPLGVGAADLHELLGETDLSLCARMVEPPAWVVDLDRWWARGTRQLAEGHRAPDLGLLGATLPAVLGARAELRAALAEIDLPVGVAEGVVVSVCDSPPVDELSALVAPAMVLELHIARERGVLRSDDPAGRFDEFAATMRDPGIAWATLSTYPVLLRALSERLGFWLARSVEIATHLAADLDELSELLWAGAIPTTARLDLGRGDSHRGGRSVSVLTTDVGRAVYKPRSARMDRALGAVLHRMAEEGAADLRLPRFLARPDHTWFAHVDERIPEGAEAARCVARLGELTAVLHCLRTTDMHYENVLVDGEHPFPVDLESVLHTERRYASREDQDLHNPAFEALEFSSLSVGIVPYRVVSGRAGDLAAADLSVFGPRDDQLSLVAVPQLVGAATDEVRIESTRAPMGRPAAEGPRSVALPLDELAFAEGFARAYGGVLRTTDAWLGPGGLLAGFAEARTRFIPRPTMIYGKVLAESFHPDFLLDALDRTMCLGKLLAGYWGRPHRDQLVGCEIADLLVGDIPFFEIEIGSGLVVHDAVPQGFGPMGRSPLDVARDYLKDEVSPAGLAVEREVIRLAFASARVAARAGQGAPAGPGPGPVPVVAPVLRNEGSEADEDLLLTCASDLADLLRRSAVRRRGVGWLSLTAATSTDWVVSPTAMDAYSGLSGIAQGLSAVAAATGEPRHHELAEEVLEQVAGYDRLILLDPISVEKTRAAFSTGAYGHLAGMALALADGARRFGRPDLLQVACRSARLLGELVGTDVECDVIAGSAGVVLAALAIEDPDVTEGLVRRAADRLVVTARRLDRGALGWPSSGGGAPLVGFSHGTTGIALALARAGGRLGDPALFDAARAALAYDRSGMVAATGDWRDLRADAAVEGHMRAWCHGAPGAGLGRAELLALGLLPDVHATLQGEILLAARATQEVVLAGTGNMSLCHGDLGNLLALEEMLAAVVDGPSRTGVREQTASLWSAVCHRGRAQGWPCGVPGGTHVPGLMMGLAGMAWGLAYAARPAGELHMLTLRCAVPAAAGVRA